jgi:alpha-tubulin suppressor-like RCC1 family protein
MDTQSLVGPWRTASRRWVALLVAGIITALTAAVASPARAHEPWVVKAWGNNKNGQLGDGTTTGPEMCGTEHLACSTTPVQVSGLSGATAVAGGRRFSLALLEDGSVMAWGRNDTGALGDGTETDSDIPMAVCAPAPEPCPGSHLSHVRAIAAGESHSLALLEDGTVMAWGSGGEGQLGNGATASSDVPVPVSGLSEKVTAIAAGGQHNLALLEGGTVVTWGNNEQGQLGNGTTTKSDVPVAVTGLSEKVKAVAAGEGYSLALLADDTVVAWGKNNSGQLGNGTETNSDVPVAVSGLTNVEALSAGRIHALAVLADKGTIMAWGSNLSGQLGDGTSEGPEKCGTPLPRFPCAKTPVAVHNLPGGISTVAAGREHSLALVERGTVLAWGKNEQGQLGDGLNIGPEGCGPGGPCSKFPVQACAEGAEKVFCSGTGPYLFDAKGIAGGEDHSLALVPLPPTVTAVSPNEPRKKGRKKAATKVTITGAEFEEATEVRFGTAKATGVKVSANGTIIEAQAPAGKGTVDVTVTTPLGTSPTSPADRFFYSRPTVKKIGPRKGPELGGTSVTIVGTSFAGTTAVKFGTTEASSFTVKSETEIVAVSPSHTSGRVDVTVSTPNGTSATSGKDRFRYT